MLKQPLNKVIVNSVRSGRIGIGLPGEPYAE